MKFKERLMMISLLPCFFYVSGSNADTDVEAGNDYHEQGDSYKAKYYYQVALIKNKNNIGALYQLAKMNFEEENYKNSFEYLNTILELDSEHIQALILRSTIFIKQQQWNKAIVDLEVAEQHDAGSSAIQMLLESAYTMKGNASKAEQHAKNYQRLRELVNQDSVTGLGK